MNAKAMQMYKKAPISLERDMVVGPPLFVNKRLAIFVVICQALKLKLFGISYSMVNSRVAIWCFADMWRLDVALRILIKCKYCVKVNE